MDAVSSIAAAAVMMQAAQTQEVVSTRLIKMASEQEQLIANMLAQNAQSGAQVPAQQIDFGFSIYA